MSLFILRGSFFSFNSTGWVESKPFYYTCVNVRARPIQVTSFLVNHQPTDVPHHSVRLVGKRHSWMRTFVWHNIVSQPEKMEHKLLNLSYSNTLCSSNQKPSLGITCDCKQQTHFPPFIVKVHVSLHQLRCMQVSLGPPNPPFPRDSASLESAFDRLAQGCRYRRAEGLTLRTPRLCLKMAALPAYWP